MPVEEPLQFTALINSSKQNKTSLPKILPATYFPKCAVVAATTTKPTSGL